MQLGPTGETLFFNYNGSAWNENMRIGSSGNLLVGKSVTTFNTPGFLYEAGAALEVTRSGNRVMRLNRTTNDGNILEFNKDGSTVGSIGSVAGVSTYIHGGAGYSGLTFGNDELLPCDESGATRDAAIDLGDSSGRFKDIYLAGRS